MDHAMEQEMEVEALEAILMEDLVEIPRRSEWEGQVSGKSWKVVLVPSLEEGTKAPEIPMRVELGFGHTATYPEEEPAWFLESLQGLSDAQLGELRASVRDAIESSIGAAMIYEMITAAQSWLDEHGGAGVDEEALAAIDPAILRARREAEEEARLAELRRLGTPVTPAAFAAWKAQHQVAKKKSAKDDGEGARSGAPSESAAATGAGGTTGGSTQGLTGKQWFLQQEMQNVRVDEPELQDGEEDGEGDRDTWSGAGDSAGDDDTSDLDDSDDDALLDELAAQKGI